MNVLEARVKRSYYVRAVILTLLTVGIGALIMRLEYRRWAKTFHDVGVTRRDGRQFFWTDFKNVNNVHVRSKSGQSFFNHVELIFNGGKVLIFPLMLENANEVMSYIGGLQRKQPSALGEGRVSYF